MFFVKPPVSSFWGIFLYIWFLGINLFITSLFLGSPFTDYCQLLFSKPFFEPGCFGFLDYSFFGFFYFYFVLNLAALLYPVVLYFYLYSYPKKIFTTHK